MLTERATTRRRVGQRMFTVALKRYRSGRRIDLELMDFAEVRIASTALILLCLATAVSLAGCQALAPANAVATIQLEAVNVDQAIEDLSKAAATDVAELVATVAAAGTAVSEHSLMNAALGATLRANFTPTPAVRAVVVSAEDMGSSLDSDMMDDMDYEDASDAPVQISDLDTARGINANSGCTTGSVKQFGTDEAQIYATARVSNLREGTTFEIDWMQQNRVVDRFSWQADYSAATECIWFYVTPQDFAFLPGGYRATLFVNGISQASTDFTITGS